jgi:hypothetical protein
MPKITITLDDVDGAVESQVVMDTDFDQRSNAHQVGYLLLKRMDELMQRQDAGLTGLQKNLGTFPSLESQMLVVDH